MKRLVIVVAASGLGLTGLTGLASAAPAAPALDAAKVAGVKWGACPTDLVQLVAANYDPLSKVAVSKIMQCGDLKVPLDHSKPRGKQITLKLTRTPHQGKGKAKGSIVVNPGGPGGEGVPFGPRVFAQNSPAMQAAYDVVGFDPRGVGRSTKLNCDTGYSAAPRPDYGNGDKKSVAVWLKKSAAYTKACAKNDKIGLLKHIKTIDSAKDLEAIRKALGTKKLDYYGASYGTYLGATYATLYPKKVGRMALDGVVGPKGVWYDANLKQDVEFDKNLDYYFGWIARYDSVYHLGKTQRSVRSWYYSLRASVAKKPLYGSVEGTKVALGSSELTDGLQTAGYRRSVGVWHTFADALSQYKNKKNTQALLDTFATPVAGGDDNSFAVYNAVQCSDTQWPTSWKKWHRDNSRIAKKHPFLTWGNAWFNAPCLTWPAKAGKPVNIGATKDLPKNILLFQSTNDAATPYSGALDMQRRLKGAHLVVQTGDRTHCIVHRGSADVDKYFDQYFLSGKLPSKKTVYVKQLGDPKPPAQQVKSASAGVSPLNDVIK